MALPQPKGKQLEVLDLKPEGHNVVLGTAGSGKTTLAIYRAIYLRFLYKGIIINHNKKLSQPTLKRRFFKKKAAFFSWPGLGKEWC